jgi:hypothetical protein
MRWRNASLTACSVVALAGCGGGGERLPVLTALDLARLADRVAGGRDDCGDSLVRAAIAVVNRGDVPAALQEQMLSDANHVRATCSRRAAAVLAERLRP